MKSWLFSKTIWINALTLILGILTTLQASEFLTPQLVLIITSIVVPILNMFLRWLTSEPITSPLKVMDRFRSKKI